MVQTNALVFGWNRPMGKIESWEPVFLNLHGGDFNGFFLIKGTHAQLDTFTSSDEFVDLLIKADLYLTNVGVNTAYTGSTVQEMMSRWAKSIPSQK